jgi:TonB family protein
VSTVFTAGAVDTSQTQTHIQILNKFEPVAAPPAREPVQLRAQKRAPKKILLAQAQAAPARPTAQDTGSLSGTVEDATGARVPQCAITVRGENGATFATATTNEAGIYRFAAVPAGRYSADYGARGFAMRTVHVQVAPGRPSRQDVELELGQILETMELRAPKQVAGAAASAAQPAPKPNPNPITVGGRVEAARVLRNPQPIYPPELQQQGIEGTVRLRAQISRDGVPVNVHILNDDEVDPRMAQAAVDAVRQWRYQPSKLDGEPVEVTTSIDVTFHLGN